MADDQNPQITLRLDADQIEKLVNVLGFGMAAEDPPIGRQEMADLYDLLTAHVDEHVVFPDEDEE